jgi:type I restriction enzyme S subunit
MLKVNDKFKLHEGDLLIAMTGATVGKLGFVPYSNDACYLNQRVGKIQSEYLFFTFLALSGTSGQKQILNFAGGAAQPNISGDQILAVKNIIPAKDILDKFELLSNNALSQILNFTRKNQLLKEARDILLPRLMTGMIDTDDMDIAV